MDSRKPRSLFAACLLWLTCALLLGCDDLSEFKTGPGEAYRGEVIGGDSDDSDDASFIRDGFATHTQMELQFDPDFAQGGAVGDAGVPSDSRPPGRLSTYVCPGNATRCA